MAASEAPVPPRDGETAGNLPFEPPDPRRWKALGVLALMQFMLILDVTVVNVALPSIRTDLGFSRSGLAWVVDAYVLMAGGLLLLGGRLADLIGRRRMFIIGVGVFAGASALCGVAVDSGMLVASRFAQGTAEAMAAPAALGLTALLFPDRKERARALGLFGGVAGLAGTLGPVISGLIIESFSWRWIFLVNLPVAFFVLLAVTRLVDESRADAATVAAARSRPDIVGAALATLALVAVVYGLIRASDHPWGSPSVVASLILGALLLVSFVLRERTAEGPLVPLSFFANRTRVAANVATLFFTTVFFSLFFLLTLYWELVRQYSPLRTGVAYLPVGIVIGLSIGLSSVLVVRLGVRLLLAVGFVLGAVGMLGLSRITVHGSYLSRPLPGLVLLALGAGFCFSGFANASLHGVSIEDASFASGVQNAVQQVGGAIGLAVLATLALRHASGAIASGTGALRAATEGYVIAFHIGSVVLAAGAIVVMVLMERTVPSPGDVTA